VFALIGVYLIYDGATQADPREQTVRATAAAIAAGW